MKLKGLRVDPGYMTLTVPDPLVAAKAVIHDCLNYGVNTIFVFAFSPVYGAYYFTNYLGSWPHPKYGANASNNFLGQLIPLAHQNGLKVVASFLMNQYQNIAQAHPAWRMLRGNGQPYQVAIGNDIVTPLCAWHPDYRTWFQGLITDVTTRFPQLDGIEACEGNVAQGFEQDQTAPDYNPVAIQNFLTNHPGARIGDKTWKQHRADGMSGLHQLLLTAVRRLPNALAYVINGTVTSPFNTTNLMSFDDYATGCGFDWRAVRTQGFDVVIQEAIWQQLEWNAELLGTPAGTFTPTWTSSAVGQFATMMPGPKPVKMAHVEVTPFSIGSRIVITPTPAQFKIALAAALNGSQGATVYSYSQLKTNGADNAYAQSLKGVYTASQLTA